METGICKVNTNARRTVRTWLKDQARAKAAGCEKLKSPVTELNTVPAVNDAEDPAVNGSTDSLGLDGELGLQTTNADVELPDASVNDSTLQLEVHTCIPVLSTSD